MRIVKKHENIHVCYYEYSDHHLCLLKTIQIWTNSIISCACKEKHLNTDGFWRHQLFTSSGSTNYLHPSKEYLYKLLHIISRSMCYKNVPLVWKSIKVSLSWKKIEVVPAFKMFWTWLLDKKLKLVFVLCSFQPWGVPSSCN